MFSFLAKRGVKDEICSFDARKITPEIRASVEELLEKNANSFDPKVSSYPSFLVDFYTEKIKKKTFLLTLTCFPTNFQEKWLLAVHLRNDCSPIIHSNCEEFFVI